MHHTVAACLIGCMELPKSCSGEARTQEVGMRGSDLLNSRSQMRGSVGAAPSRCSLSYKRQSWKSTINPSSNKVQLIAGASDHQPHKMLKITFTGNYWTMLLYMVLNEHIFERLFIQYIFKSNEAHLRIIAEIIQLLKLNYGT